MHWRGLASLSQSSNVASVQINKEITGERIPRRQGKKWRTKVDSSSLRHIAFSRSGEKIYVISRPPGLVMHRGRKNVNVAFQIVQFLDHPGARCAHRQTIILRLQVTLHDSPLHRVAICGFTSSSSFSLLLQLDPCGSYTTLPPARQSPAPARQPTRSALRRRCGR